MKNILKQVLCLFNGFGYIVADRTLVTYLQDVESLILGDDNLHNNLSIATSVTWICYNDIIILLLLKVMTSIIIIIIYTSRYSLI